MAGGEYSTGGQRKARCLRRGGVRLKTFSGLFLMCCVVGGECYALMQLSQLKPKSVVSGYAKKVYVAIRAGHIRRCKTRIYGKGAEMYKGIYKKVHR